MFGSASQGGEQADQLYFGMLGSLIAFLWSAAEHLPEFKGIFPQLRWVPMCSTQPYHRSNSIIRHSSLVTHHYLSRFLQVSSWLADNYISRNWFQSFIDRNIPVQQP